MMYREPLLRQRSNFSSPGHQSVNTSWTGWMKDLTSGSDWSAGIYSLWSVESGWCIIPLTISDWPIKLSKQFGQHATLVMGSCSSLDKSQLSSCLFYEHFSMDQFITFLMVAGSICLLLILLTISVLFLFTVCQSIVVRKLTQQIWIKLH